MLVINNQINQYAVCKPESNEVEFIIDSYYPMNEEDVVTTLYQEGIIREKGSIVVKKITSENVCEFNIPENYKLVSNLND